MTKKQLIDYCNNHMSKHVHACDICDHKAECNAFFCKHHFAPYLENKMHEGKYYTEEEIQA